MKLKWKLEVSFQKKKIDFHKRGLHLHPIRDIIINNIKIADVNCKGGGLEWC